MDLELIKEHVTRNGRKIDFLNPDESTYHDRVYVVDDGFGLIIAINADCLQDALDELADSGKLDGHLLSTVVESEQKEYHDDGQVWSLGNYCLDYINVGWNIQELTR